MFDSLCAVQRGPARAGSAPWGCVQVFVLASNCSLHLPLTRHENPIGQLVESSSAKHVH